MANELQFLAADNLRVLHEEKENVAKFPEGSQGTHRKPLPFYSGGVMFAALLNYIINDNVIFKKDIR